MTGSGTPALQVAVPSPLRRLFDYLPPDGVNVGDVKAGTRVRVPFGRRQVIGVVTGRVPGSDLPR